MVTFKDDLAMWINPTDDWKILMNDVDLYRKFQHNFFHNLPQELFTEYEIKVGFNDPKPAVKHVYGIATRKKVYKLEIVVAQINMVPKMYEGYKKIYLETSNGNDNGPTPGPDNV